MMLYERSVLLQKIRFFFEEKKVLEVDTPHLSKASGTDPHVESFTCKNVADDTQYLQTSPEFFMKRLLCAGSGDIYQLAHVFRKEPEGSQHRQEFMMLEWYRLGFDIHDLMNEVFALVSLFLPNLERQNYTYQEVFQNYLGLDDVMDEEASILQKIWQQHSKQTIDSPMSHHDWLDLLMADVIEPQLQGAVFIYDYPSAQASLAKIKHGVAQRFELYVNGMELANGFDELQDASEQRNRFEAENKQRVAMGLETVTLDEDLLQALENEGLPQCAGVALGVDRLLMLSLGKKDIQEVMLF